MIKIIFVCLLILPFELLIGQVELPEGKFPYNQFVEWPSVGGLFLNHDPSEKARDFNLTFVNAEGKVQWQETIYPKGYDLIPIVSQESNYIYFLDNLEIIKNKLQYHQINKSGSVTSTNIDFLRDLKKFGYNTPSDAIIQNVVNTSSALVIQLLLENKDEKVYDHILFFITHHNHRTYSAKMEPTSFNNLKEENTSTPYFAGSKGSDIYFAQLSSTGSTPKAIFYPFDEKGKKGNEVVLKLKDFKPFETTVNQRTMQGVGEYRKFDYYPKSLGFAFYQEGRFYFAQQSEKSKSLELWQLNDKNNLEKTYSGKVSDVDKRRFDVELSIAYSGKEWVFGSKIHETSAVILIQPKGAQNLNVESHNVLEKGQYNFSIFHHLDFLDNYVLPIEDEKLLLNRSELPNKEIKLNLKK